MGNLKGTMRLIELCRKMERLEALVHVSTAYANCDKEEIGEMIYPPPADPHKLMDCVDWMDEDLLNSITEKLLKPPKHVHLYESSCRAFAYRRMWNNSCRHCKTHHRHCGLERTSPRMGR